MNTTVKAGIPTQRDVDKANATAQELFKDQTPHPHPTRTV